MHVLTPAVFDLLDRLVRETSANSARSSSRPHLTRWRANERYLALETRAPGTTSGVKFGVVEAQIALAMAGVDRERILALLLESIIRVEQNDPRELGTPQLSHRVVGHVGLQRALTLQSMSQVGQLLIETITHSDPAIRDRSVRELAAPASLAEKLEACRELEEFRRSRQNLYERVRASLFLHALYRYEIQEDAAIRGRG